MQSYRVYYTRGHFIPLADLEIPDGSPAIVTVLEELTDEISLRQRAAMERFREVMRSTGPLPAAYDEIMEEHTNIAREPDL